MKELLSRKRHQLKIKLLRRTRCKNISQGRPFPSTLLGDRRPEDPSTLAGELRTYADETTTSVASTSEPSPSEASPIDCPMLGDGTGAVSLLKRKRRCPDGE